MPPPPKKEPVAPPPLPYRDNDSSTPSWDSQAFAAWQAELPRVPSAAADNEATVMRRENDRLRNIIIDLLLKHGAP